MKTEADLKEALDESLIEVNKEESENFQPKDVTTMNRYERNSRLKYFNKLFKEHVKRKPSVNIDEEDPKKLEAQTIRMQRWATRYAILTKKIDELKAVKRYYKGSDK